ncbi:V-type ATP synthase subunit I [Bacteroides helcogenes]|uniref:V-type ATPase 116 kDa subunit n=1 Tax=Bacteroides helcogenes (strain ATCC 35417 / DSM 20613 / JCM 6297 / CCUG 15421 / P 36-108) TaxID=693979 RepID=E6SQQ5_BACT6|nr:V-type ATPase 116kDa subunit family protein [Bacteroides helcogenes]ADV43988.1 V-type ATPase 116 kDa subunit [Bacteroides helcogenes P 36-108]MDY5237812.1 V-type ATPase 116kDa subunit family protein [Bacteroides helcogenes]
MITKMKKLTFLVYHKEYEAFLGQIRELGVVHIVERQSGEMDDSLQQFMQKRTLYRNMLRNMYLLADKQPQEVVHKEVSADALVKEYEDLQMRIQDFNQQLPAIDKDISQMEIWGDFDWNGIRRLESSGWYVRFYTCPEKDYDEAWNEDCNALIVKENGGHLYFVTVTPQSSGPDVEPLRLPSMGLSELNRRKADTEEALSKAVLELKEFCKSNYRTLEEADLQLQGDIDLLKVKLNSESLAEGSVVVLEGWVPEDSEAEVRTLLEAGGIYYEMRNATREDNAPIKLKNNAFTRMYEVLTKMYGMPDYAEFDPTPILAPFFSLFFAFCMGDAGYGLVLIALGFFLKKRMSESLRGMMNLVITLGIFTAVFGAVLGTFFGVSLFDLELPEGMKQFMIVGKIGETTYDKQMLLALIIGAVHICLAMTVKAVGQTVRFGFKESLSAWGWLLLVVGFICTGGLSFFKVISEDVSTWAFIVIGGVSAIGIYLLNNIHRNVLINIGAGVWDTYNMATGLMGDILSYIRLYALGLAGGMLGGVFNQLAFMVNDSAGPVLGWLFCGLILIFGHSLNIAMSCLSAFVHPLRLTFVEYFKNSGYNGKGEAYKPFTVVKNK